MKAKDAVITSSNSALFPSLHAGDKVTVVKSFFRNGEGWARVRPAGGGAVVDVPAIFVGHESSVKVDAAEEFFCCFACGLDGKVLGEGAVNDNAVAPGDANFETYKDHPAWRHAACA